MTAGLATQTAIAMVLGYLLGSIPFGLLITRMAGFGDIRSIGSGNIGTTNVLRTGRKELAALTLLLDAGKGAAAVLIARYFFPYPPLSSDPVTARTRSRIVSASSRLSERAYGLPDCGTVRCLQTVDVRISRCNFFSENPWAMNSLANQSSNCGSVGTVPSRPNSPGVGTIPLPK